MLHIVGEYKEACISALLITPQEALGRGGLCGGGGSGFENGENGEFWVNFSGNRRKGVARRREW
jgi:hypothetical protein